MTSVFIFTATKVHRNHEGPFELEISYRYYMVHTWESVHHVQITNLWTFTQGPQHSHCSSFWWIYSALVHECKAGNTAPVSHSLWGCHLRWPWPAAVRSQGTPISALSPCSVGKLAGHSIHVQMSAMHLAIRPSRKSTRLSPVGFASI